MNSTTMQAPVQLNEEFNQQLSNEATAETTTSDKVNNSAGKRNFTAAQMWFRQRNVRSASRLHRRIPR